MEDASLLRGSNCRAKGAAPGFKVAILGAAGGIGQPLALLMKMNPLVSVLHLYDVVNTPGVTADISHMNTGAVVCSTLSEITKIFSNVDSEDLNGRLLLQLVDGRSLLQLVPIWTLRSYLEDIECCSLHL